MINATQIPKVNGAAAGIAAVADRTEEDSPMTAREDRIDDLLRALIEQNRTVIEQNQKLPTQIAEHIAIRMGNGNGNGSKDIKSWFAIAFVLITSLISIGALYNKLLNAVDVITDLKRDVAVERERVNELRLDVARGQAKIEELTKRGETRNAGSN